MANDLKKMSAGVIEMGVDAFTPDFTPELGLTVNSYNLMTGINQGTGPRYGMSPIPGHNVVAAGASEGLRGTEAGTGSLFNRSKFLAFLSIKLNDYATQDIQSDYLLWFLGHDTTSAALGAIKTTTLALNEVSAGSTYQSSIESSLSEPFWRQLAIDTNAYASVIVRRALRSTPNSQTVDEYVKDALKVDSGLYYCSSAAMSISGKKIPNKWVVGKKVTNGAANTTAIANMNLSFLRAGLPSSWQLGNFDLSPRALKFYNFDGTQLLQGFIYAAYQMQAGTFIPTFNQDTASASFALTGVGAPEANLRGAAFVPANVQYVLVKDDAGFTESSYKIALFALNGAQAFLIQEWDRNEDGQVVQLAPLLDRFFKPQIISNTYSEFGVIVATCFSRFPAYDGTTAITNYSTGATGSGNHVFLGAAGSGILRANSTYELTFSVFDKQLGTETNVGRPVKFLTGATDFVAVSVAADIFAGGFYQQKMPIQTNPILGGDAFNAAVGGAALIPENHMEVRFYYRPLGSYEWLPALFLDLTDFWYNVEEHVRWACTGQIAALPGGQPGGFIDNSFLPDDKYTCVINFKNRAFWISPKNMVFSLQNNPFAYPLRNAVSAPTGGFKGGIIHTYRGQSEQESRLIVFAQKETYIGKFNGLLLQMPVVVSSNTTATFDVDGSDFKLEPWTSITAFSFRSAVVADGILFWWGPQGVYRDDGVDVPRKISRNLEPNIFTIYDQTKTDEIHCVYDEKTKDIVWFYTPSTDSTITYAMTYDVEKEEFFFDRFNMKIDWATRISLGSMSQYKQVGDLRTVISARSSTASAIQRGYFFDSMNRSGDYRPTTELMCSRIQAGATSTQYIVTLDNGLDAANFATIVAGDFIAFHQFQQYAVQTTGVDMICKVVSTDPATRKITFQVPTGATLPIIAFGGGTSYKFFPIWHRAKAGAGLHGITYVWDSKYWMPKGINFSWIWLYVYMFFKYTTWLKVDPETFSFAYKSASGGTMITDPIRFADNSDTNFQVYHALREGKLNNQGQAIKMKISGYHIGEEWSLQYLEAHATEESGNLLKRYQG